jgi:uncharacterized protein (DUF2384 family)
MESNLFRTVPANDVLRFGQGDSFDAKRVAEWFDLDKQAVSRISSVARTSVRYDDHIPRAVRDRLEEIGSIANMVAGVFQGDAAKAALWFRTRNPMLGDISPRDMVRLGRYDKLRKFIVNASVEREHR